MTAPKYSTDPHLDAALQKDAAYLEAMGEGAGATLEALASDDDDYPWFNDADMESR